MVSAASARLSSCAARDAGHASARFGTAGPEQVLQRLSDDGAVFAVFETVIEADRTGLSPITTHVASPESSGVSEAMVNTLRRDRLDGADRSSTPLSSIQDQHTSDSCAKRAPQSSQVQPGPEWADIDTHLMSPGFVVTIDQYGDFSALDIVERQTHE